jgi:hypothetical protein
MKSLNFEISYIQPNEFIYVYSAILYPDNEQDIIRYAIKICNDSFFTYGNNVYKNYVVAIACIMLAARFLSLPAISDKSFRHLDNMKAFHIPPAEEAEFNERLIYVTNRSVGIEKDMSNGSYYEILEWNKKIHPYMSVTDLTECLKILTDFYEDVLNKHTGGNPKK